MEVISVKRKRPIPKWKIEEVQRLKELISKHEVVGIADITGIGSSQLYEIRSKLREKAVLRVSKNTLMKRAIEEIKRSRDGLEKLTEFLKGQNIFIFTNMNPFELSLFLERNKVARPARGGDIAPRDIVIPAGNTGFTPGPIISKFNQYKVPIRIEEGSIVVTRDTVVVKKGETIPADLADLLNRLDLKPIEVGLSLKALYFKGRVLTEDELHVDIEHYKADLSKAYSDAVSLAVGIAYPSKETLDLSLLLAYSRALGLAINLAYPTKETLSHLVIKALSEANSLINIIAPKHPELGFEVSEAKAEETKEEEAKEEEKKEEESKEEEIAEGLAGLFG